MVAEAVQFVDVDGAVREWARDSVPELSRRVFFGVNDAAAFPQARVWYVGGPQEAARYQFDVWGQKGQGRAAVDAVARALATAAQGLTRYQHDETLLHGATVEGRPQFAPDDTSDQPRSIVDVVFIATGVE